MTTFLSLVLERAVIGTFGFILLYEIIRSLDEATRDIDAGKGVSVSAIRQQVGSWAAK